MHKNVCYLERERICSNGYVIHESNFIDALAPKDLRTDLTLNKNNNNTLSAANYVEKKEPNLKMLDSSFIQTCYWSLIN